MQCSKSAPAAWQVHSRAAAVLLPASAAATQPAAHRVPTCANGRSSRKVAPFMVQAVICRALPGVTAALPPAATLATPWTCRIQSNTGQCCSVGTTQLGARNSAGPTTALTAPSQVAGVHAATAIMPCSVQRGCTSGISIY